MGPDHQALGLFALCVFEVLEDLLAQVQSAISAPCGTDFLGLDHDTSWSNQTSGGKRAGLVKKEALEQEFGLFACAPNDLRPGAGTAPIQSFSGTPAGEGRLRMLR